jgi:uncharacterized protein YoxC
MRETPVKVPTAVYIGGALIFMLLAAIAVLLTMLLGVLRDSREHIVTTDTRIAQLQGQIDPALRQAQPVVQSVEPLVRDARGLVKPLKGTAESLTSAADALPAALQSAVVLFDRVRPLVDQSLPLVSSATALVDGLDESDAVNSIRVLGDVGRAVAAQRLLPKLSDTLDRVPHFEDLAVELTQIQRRTVKIQVRSLRTQQRTLRLLFQSIGIQRAVLQHTENIDRKTAVLPTAPAAP